MKSCNPFHLGMTTVGVFGQGLLQVIVGKFLAFSLDCFTHRAYLQALLIVGSQ